MYEPWAILHVVFHPEHDDKEIRIFIEFMWWASCSYVSQISKGKASDLNPAETMPAVWQLQRLSY